MSSNNANKPKAKAWIQYKKQQPSLASIKQGRSILFYPRKDLSINQQNQLSQLYYQKIRHNHAISQAPPGLYTWIIKSEDDRIESASTESMNMYAVKTCTKQELGTLHLNLDSLTRSYADDNGTIIAAGELEVRMDGSIGFNLLSGSYMWDKRVALLKKYSSNQTVLASINKKKRTNKNTERISRATEQMFRMIAERATHAIQQLTGVDEVEFLESPNSSGGRNLIAPHNIPLQPENDPILCDYFDMIAVDEKMQDVAESLMPSAAAAAAAAAASSIQHRPINKSKKSASHHRTPSMKWRSALTKLKSLRAFSQTKKNPSRRK